MIRHVLKRGFSRVRSGKRMVLLYYFANTVFAGVIVFPAYLMLDRFADQSLLGASLEGGLDLDLLIEFARYNTSGLTAIAAVALLVVPLAWMAGLFLSGGAYAVFSIEAEMTAYTPILFWGGAARYFGRFIRLTLMMIPVCAVVLCLPLLEKGIERVVFGDDPYQNISYWGGWIRTGLMFVSIVLCGVLLDYARIHTVLTDEQRMRKAVTRSVRFTVSHPGRTFVLALAVFTIGAVILTVYAGIAPLLSFPGSAAVVLLLLLQQAVIFTRMALRLTLYASQLELFRTLS